MSHQVKRVKNVSVEKGIVTGSSMAAPQGGAVRHEARAAERRAHLALFPPVGTAAFWLGKVDRKPEEHSHRWTVYVRGAHNEDLSYFIKRVTFQLYQTYENPNRGTRLPGGGVRIGSHVGRTLGANG